MKSLIICKHLGASKWASQAVLVVKNQPASVGKVRDRVQSLGWEDPGKEGNGNPLQYSYLENPMDRRT